MDASTPAQIGRFQVLKRLGGGGFSEVLLARDLRQQNYGEKVVLKRLRPGLLHRDPVFLDSLLCEAEVGMVVRSPYVVRVDCVLDHGGEPTVVMEYVHGYRLDKLMRVIAGQGMSADAVAEIVRQLCEGLVAIHQARDAGGNSMDVVHQDVKPTNVIVTAAGGVKLLDLGLARPQRKPSSSLWVRQGTPGYRSPEQSQGLSSLTSASDLYAVGVIMYELLRGANLFSLDDHGTDVILERQRQLSIHLEILASRMAPPGLDVILKRLLAFDLKERYQCAGDVIRELVYWQRAWNSGFQLSQYVERIAPRLDALPEEAAEPGQIHCRDTQPGERIPEEAAPGIDWDHDIPFGDRMIAVDFFPFDDHSLPRSVGVPALPQIPGGPVSQAVVAQKSFSTRRLLRRISASFGAR